MPGQHEFNDLTPLKKVLHFYASGSKSIELSENLMRTSFLQLNSCRKDYVDGKFFKKKYYRMKLPGAENWIYLLEPFHIEK